MMNASRLTLSVFTSKPSDTNPGDEAPPGSPGTGEAVCPDCSGSGRIEGKRCETCGGSGKVVKGIGGA